MLDDAAYEMGFVPAMVDAAERIIGDYPFERYDLIFPPGFGGGMENPNLNFIGPDAITGNRPATVPLSGLIAHELAHSWFGDMITCATWSDTWLNEGFATYYEKRILEEMQGYERAELGFHLDLGAYNSILGTGTPEASLILHRTFTETQGPGNAFNTIAYQKGGLFLKMLEDRLGRSVFDAFIYRYVARNAYDWVDDQRFLADLQATLDSRGVSAAPLLLQTWQIGRAHV